MTIPGLPSKRRKRAVTVILGMLGLAFIVYTARLYTLQVDRSPEYRTRARQIALRARKITARRGDIFDRHGELMLTTSIDAFSVLVTPAAIPENRLSQVASDLAHVLDQSPESILKKITEVDFPNAPVEIARVAPAETIYAIAELIEKDPGIQWKSSPVRHYTDPG